MATEAPFKIYDGRIHLAKDIRRGAIMPSPFLREAVAIRPCPGQAIDLGCGGGKDTFFLLQQGYFVVALDVNQQALDTLTGWVCSPRNLGWDSQDAVSSRLKVVRASYEDYPLPEEAFDIVNAAATFYSNPPEFFQNGFQTILRSVKQGGILTCDLLGEKSRIRNSKYNGTRHRREELTMLFEPLQISKVVETDNEAVDDRGQINRWHLYRVMVYQPIR